MAGLIGPVTINFRSATARFKGVLTEGSPMRLTRSAAEPAGLGGLLVVLAILAESPLFLLGAIVIGAAGLTAQSRFLGEVLDLKSGLAVEQTIGRAIVSTDEATPISLHASAETPLSVTISTDPPKTTDIAGDQPPQVHLDRLQTATASDQWAWPVAGAMTIPAPSVKATDATNWFETSFRHGPAQEVVVEPRRVRSMHVGEGGAPIATAYGEHAGGQQGSGITPAEIREYTPGDLVSRIDWKATARLGDLYVREFEAESELEIAIILDHRSALGEEAHRGSKFDFLRQFALAYTAEARDLHDPLGLVGIGDEGVTVFERPGTRDATYTHIRRLLLELEPTKPTDTGERVPDSATTEARERALRLDADTAFGQRLGPFLDRRPRYVERVKDRPLFAGTRLLVDQLPQNRLCLFLSDDTHRTELREAVKLAARGDGRVMVFLTPSTLFEPAGLADMDRAYQGYVDFEEYRRDLDAIEGVRAFEIAPEDRVAAVLSQAQTGGTAA